MISDSPDPVEVTDFHFHQLRTLRLIKGNEKISSTSVSIIAAASKFGLLFVGFEGGFKVLKFEDVLQLDKNKENKSIEENYVSTTVECPTPIILSLNESQQILAVCSLTQLGSSFSFYDVTTFGSQGSHWQPSISMPPKSAAAVRDFVWNPANDNLFAYCLSDGSLHIEMISSGAVKPAASLASANATSVCWSPKGKQLVAGRSDGCFTQYKPSLQEVKTIPAPQLDGSAMSVSSIGWISNTQFVVLYVSANSPYLCMVSTPKDSPVTYINYYDVCLGNCRNPNQRYFFYLEPSWGILICGSIDSIEIAVLGNMPSWVQWDLKEDGKALMPGKDGASHPVGLAVMYCAQKPIVISDIESYAPMPLIFFVTDNGLLVSFHMINSKADAVNLVSAPLVQETRKAEEMHSSVSEPERIVLKRSSSSAVQPVSSCVPTTPAMNSTFSMEATQSPQSSLIAAKPAAADQPFKNQNNQSELPNTQNQSAVLKSSEKRSSEADHPTQNLSRPWETTTVKPSPISALKKKSEMQSSLDSSCMAAILSEMYSFSKELQELKQLQNTIPSMDNVDEMARLKLFAMNLQNFQKDIAEAMQSLSRKSHTLKNVLLESFMTVEEASSRDRRKNDHSYITLLKERTLNPATAKHMAKINQHYQYLNTQLLEVNNKLDQDWINLRSQQEALRNNSDISSTEAIYKTFVNNQKIIHNLKKRVDALTRKTEEKKMKSVSRGNSWRIYQKRTNNEDLSKLADEFLQLKCAVKEDQESAPARKLSSESQNFLRDFLKESMVVTVRPTAVYLPPQSRLISNASFSESYAVEVQQKDKSPHQSDASVQAETIQPINSEAVLPKTSTSFSTSFENSRNEPMDSSSKPTAILKEKTTFMPESALPITSTPDVNIFKQSEQKTVGTPTSVIDSSENISTNVPRSLFAENVSKMDVSKSLETSIFTKAHSVTDSVPKSLENTANNISTVSPTFSVPLIAPQPVSSSQITISNVSSLASPVLNANFTKPTSVGSVFTPTSLQSTTKGLLTSEGSAFKSQEPAKAPFSSFSFGAQATTFTPTTTKTPQAFPSFSVPENKSIFNLPSSESTSFPQTPFQMPATVVPSTTTTSIFSNQSSTEKNDQPFSGVVSSVMESPSVASDSPDKIIVIDTKTSSPDKVIVIDTKTTSSPQVVSVKTSQESVFSDKSLSQITITPLPQIGASSEINNTVADNIPNTVVSINDLSSSASNSSIPVRTSASISIFNTPETSQATTTITETTTATRTAAATSIITPNISVVSQPASTASIPTSAIFTPTTEMTPSFTQATLTTTSAVSTTTSANASDSIATSPPPVFGSQTTSQTPTETPLLFGKPATTQAAPVFGQTTPDQTVSTSGFAQAPAAGGFFSQTPTFGVGGDASSASTTPFSFGKPAFGAAQPTGSFGLASSVFGQTTTGYTQPTSPASSFSFGQAANNNNPTSVFGQGSFFSGLGGKPSEENANKNVFGLTSNIKASSENNNLFGNTTAPAFGAKTGTFGGGSFSSGGGSVAQSGFGSFQQTTPQKAGGFGFGSAPTFGSAPAFGSPPTFGSGNALSSVFGQQQQQPQANFSNFASASSPTFGSLASQGPVFGNTSPVSSFGSFGQTASPFGGQPSGFGSPSSPPSNSSAFTQWRN